MHKVLYSGLLQKHMRTRHNDRNPLLCENSQNILLSRWNFVRMLTKASTFQSRFETGNSSMHSFQKTVFFKKGWTTELTRFYILLLLRAFSYFFLQQNRDSRLKTNCAIQYSQTRMRYIKNLPIPSVGRVGRRHVFTLWTKEKDIAQASYWSLDLCAGFFFRIIFRPFLSE